MTGDPFTIGAIYRSANGVHQEPFIGTTIGHLQNRVQGASMLCLADASQARYKQIFKVRLNCACIPHLRPLQTL